MATKKNAETELVLTFSFERETKNTIRFAEQVEDQLDTPNIGTIYMAKSALKSLGWKQGQELSLTLSIK